MKTKLIARILLSVSFAVSSTLLFAAVGPANDNCTTTSTTNPPFLTSSSSGSCLNNQSLQDATTSSAAGTCGGTTAYDVWYRYVGKGTPVTVSVNTTGTLLTNATTYIEVFSGTCGGTFTSLGCATAANGLTTIALTNTTTYYIRVYVVTNPNTNGANKYDFNICLYDTPSNDNCTGATTLTANTTCSGTSGSIIAATASSGIPSGCASSGTIYDVWYKFTAVKTYELISISSVGNNLTNPELQLFSGSCGSLTSLQCGTTSIAATGLTIGTTYYVRVSNIGSAINTAGDFSICVYHPTSAITADYSRGYINVTKGTTGGTVVPGDILEMRATLVITAGTLNNLTYYDTIYSGSGLTFVPGSLSIRSNEGKIVGSAYTDGFDTDGGWTSASGANTALQINFGTGATNASGGSMTNTSIPKVFSTSIVMATYRVQVTGAYNTSVNFKTGALSYLDPNTGITNKITFSPNYFVVYSSPGLCPNSVSPTNALAAETNGSFGTATGNTPAQNRAITTTYTSYGYVAFGGGTGPNDNKYGIANNTSANGTNVQTLDKPDATGGRVFSLWDISGDHGGTTKTAAGNPPCDLTKPVSASNPCGYMLVINSAYKADTAFQYTVTNLCSNTYYEISAWFKNICYKCGSDMNGIQAQSGNTAYIPTATGDSSGVRPNIAFDVNGKDYYTTGDILYYGATPTGSDATNQWVKRGFTYLTGPSETSFTLTLRNNAPGGGGNDWALDDIAVATCSPDVAFTPTSTPSVCSGNVASLKGTVTSYFNNYTQYKWQKSTDTGTTWTDVTGTNNTGTGTPTTNGSGQYEYATATYDTPPLTSADAGIKYRLITATTSTNLTSSSCNVTGSIELIPSINSCTPVLGTSFISFNTKMEEGNSVIRWTTSQEKELLSYVIEKSTDGNLFTQVAVVDGYQNASNYLNTYKWSEPYGNEKVYYRVKMKSKLNGDKYSRIEMIGSNVFSGIELLSAMNPFNDELRLELKTSQADVIKMQMIDNNGVVVFAQNYTLAAGQNRLIIKQPKSLAASIYTLTISTSKGNISRKLVKQ
jgi:hypothetical protein